MSEEFRKIIDQTDDDAVELRELIPGTMRAFGGLARAAQTPGALDRRTKELIALAISVSARCDACIAYHARGASRAGASRAEIAEALGVAVQMGGGPAVNYAARALAAFDELNTAQTVGA